VHVPSNTVKYDPIVHDVQPLLDEFEHVAHKEEKHGEQSAEDEL